MHQASIEGARIPNDKFLLQLRALRAEYKARHALIADFLQALNPTSSKVQ